MKWIDTYDLFLFDLDGLLVNTEELHFRAYKTMCQNRGYTLKLTFPEYFQIAQRDAKAPQMHIYGEFPELQQEEPNWSVLYTEKKQALLTILKNEPAPLLPGVEQVLHTLHRKNKKRAVVTHSLRELVDLLKKQNPVLNSIPYWFTREDYDAPKPAPDGYLKALDQIGTAHDRAIGFEDSERGMKALMATRAVPILINALDPAMRRQFAQQGVHTFTSFEDIEL